MKVHKKLYKAKKQWCCMALATGIMIATTALVPGHSVFADAATSTEDTQPITEISSENNITKTSNAQQSNLISTVSHSTEVDQASATTTRENKTSNQVSNSGRSSQEVSQQSLENNDADMNAQTNNTQNGWVKSAEGKMTFYQNGTLLNGRHYVNLPTIPDTNVPGKTNWYLMDNGVAQSGFQEWMGSHYYFDPRTYLVVQDKYVDPDHNNSGYLLGKDGIALNGIQKWQGTYFAFDYKTYRLVKDQNFQEWGYTYHTDDQGRVISGLYRDAKGDVYYSDPASYILQTNNYVVPTGTDRGYLFGSDGRALSGLQQWQGSYWYFDPQNHQLIRNSYVDPDGNNTGYLLAPDGRALNGIQNWQGTYYAFDYKTYRLVKNQNFQEWGYTYHVDDQGRVISGLYRDANGDVYYGEPNSYILKTNTYFVPEGTQNGYLFGNDGKALSGVQRWLGTFYYFDPVTKQLVRNDYVKSQWGQYYMFGNDGKIITGEYQWQGSYYYFDPIYYTKVTNKWVDGKYYGEDGIQYRNRLLIQGTKAYYLDGQGNRIKNQVKTIDGVTYTFNNDGVANVPVKPIDPAMSTTDSSVQYQRS